MNPRVILNYIYNNMRKMYLGFCVHTGDLVYYDRGRPYVANTVLAHYKWNPMCVLPLVCRIPIVLLAHHGCYCPSYQVSLPNRAGEVRTSCAFGAQGLSNGF